MFSFWYILTCRSVTNPGKEFCPDHRALQTYSTILDLVRFGFNVHLLQLHATGIAVVNLTSILAMNYLICIFASGPGALARVTLVATSSMGDLGSSPRSSEQAVQIHTTRL